MPQLGKALHIGISVLIPLRIWGVPGNASAQLVELRQAVAGLAERLSPGVGCDVLVERADVSLNWASEAFDSPCTQPSMAITSTARSNIQISSGANTLRLPSNSLLSRPKSRTRTPAALTA
jgi:hypothetical protein